MGRQRRPQAIICLLGLLSAFYNQEVYKMSKVNTKVTTGTFSFGLFICAVTCAEICSFVDHLALILSVI